MQLNGERVQAAWDDYKGFLESMGMDSNKFVLHQIQQAFKMGFASGEKQTIQEPKTMKFNVPVHVAPPMHGEQVFIKHKTTKRSVQQLQQDARLVASIMQRNGGPMYLKEITVAVNAAGSNWWPKSASSHMNMVMEKYPTIKKLRRGVYLYEQ